MFYKTDSEGYRDLLPGVRLKTLAFGDKTHLTEVHFVNGAVIPVHQHPHEQTGYLVSGCLRFTVENEQIIARPGDSWSMKSEVPHGAEALEDSVVVEVFSPLREDYLP